MKNIYLFCLLVFSSVLVGQNPITISGSLTDINGSGISDYPVFFISQQDSNYFLITSTDVNGFFQTDYDEGQSQGCLDVVTINCDGTTLSQNICWDPTNVDYTVDFTLDCGNTSDSCFVYIEQELTGNGETILTAQSPNATVPVNFSWSTGDSTQSIIVMEDGDYCVTMEDADGCVAFSCTTVGIPQFCDAFFYYDPFFGFIEALAAGEGEITYQWTYDSIDLNLNTPIIDIVGEGEYCVTIEDEAGCTSTFCDYVLIDSIPFEDCFAFIYSELDSLSGETLIAQAFGQPPFTYSWSTGQTTQSIQIQNDTLYCVEVTDASGCMVTTCYEPYVWEDCSVYVSCDPTPAGVSLVALAYGLGPFTYEWSTGDSTEHIEVTESGDYCVTVTDATGCVSEWCQFVHVGGFNVCEFEIEILDINDSIAVVDVIVFDSSQFVFYLNDVEVQFPLDLTLGNVYCFEGVDSLNGCASFVCIDLDWSNPFCQGFAFIEVDSTNNGLYTLTANVFEGSGTYDVIWSNGEVGQTITVGNSPEGYCADIYDVLDSCFYTACVEIITNPGGNELFVVGLLVDGDNGFPLDGTVTIYEKEDTILTELSTLDVENGLFTANLDCNNEYIFKGNGIDPEGIEEYIPTFSISEEFWENAEIISCNTQQNLAIVHIDAINLHGIGGPGTVEGFVYDGDNFTTGNGGNRGDEPIEDADIYLMTLDMIPVKHVITDGEGKFVITEIAYGTYNVYLAIPGKKTQHVQITISPSQTIISGVEFDTDGIISSSNDLNSIEVQISPNPTADVLNVMGFDVKGFKVTLYDQVGRVMMNDIMDGQELNVSQIPNGIYMVRFTNDVSVASAKFIKI